MCFGLFAAWILVSVSWLVFGRTRWSLRFQPLLLLFGITLGLTNILPADVDERVLIHVASGLFSVMLIYVLVLTLLRRFRYRLELDVARERLLPYNSKNQTHSIALRDLFAYRLRGWRLYRTMLFHLTLGIIARKQLF